MSRQTAALLPFLVLFAAAADAATVRGNVTAASGARLSGKVVAAYDTAGGLAGTASTDSAGTYVLTVAAGNYRLLAYDPTGEYATAFYGAADSYETTPVVRVTDTAAFEANFTLPDGGRITGFVIGSTGAIGGAVVEAYNLSGTRRGFTTASASGEYSLVVPAGEYKLFAYDANGFWAGEFHADARAFAEAAPVRVTPPGATTITFALDRAARVSGIITDARSALRVPSLLVYAYTAAGALVAQTTSDLTGFFRFALGPGQYRFVAADPELEYGPAFFAASRSFERSDVVTLTAGQERPNLDFAVQRGAIVTGQVIGPANATIAVYNVDGTLHTSTTAGADGTYRLVVAPGDYRIAAFDYTGAYATQFFPLAAHFGAARDVRVLGGELLTLIDFMPERAGRFTGTVRDAATQAPLAGMTVAAYDAAGVLMARAITAANGTYSLSVPAGSYLLTAFDAAFQYATAYAAAPAGITAGANVSTDFTMRRGTRVTGTVVAQGGGGIDGAEVFAFDGAGNRAGGGTTTNGGAFTMVVVPGTYDFAVTDPRSRYFPSAATRVAVGTQSPPPLAFTLAPARRHRAARK